jgi:regulator of RNase E activity RraA
MKRREAAAQEFGWTGHRSQALRRHITAFTVANRVAGLASTAQGYPCADPESNDMATRLSILDSLQPGTVAGWACGGSMDCAHWGEIMSTAARERGCTGAVVEGGVRDVDYVNAMNYPVFARYKSSATSLGDQGAPGSHQDRKHDYPSRGLRIRRCGRRGHRPRGSHIGGS